MQRFVAPNAQSAHHVVHTPPAADYLTTCHERAVTS